MVSSSVQKFRGAAPLRRALPFNAHGASRLLNVSQQQNTNVCETTLAKTGLHCRPNVAEQRIRSDEVDKSRVKDGTRCGVSGGN